eukprot:CAMPEP_0114260114 /NCGR_PEP_ID=MMETSP0058-20121206/20285_1 /TAXON_ID=36894 /ORGANISM="Pyramimonas parkeae, CCMP726" /LENGTH=111 /DNA_ID=CAMNT_0001375269 /DNA_START=265 /DNA_END=596 /DNA_ORIENTATION=-
MHKYLDGGIVAYDALQGKPLLNQLSGHKLGRALVLGLLVFEIQHRQHAVPVAFHHGSFTQPPYHDVLHVHGAALGPAARAFLPTREPPATVSASGSAPAPALANSAEACDA